MRKSERRIIIAPHITEKSSELMAETLEARNLMFSRLAKKPTRLR